MPAKTDRISKFHEIYNQVLLLSLCAFVISCPFTKRISKVILIFSLSLYLCAGILSIRNIFKFRFADLWARSYMPMLIFFIAAIISTLFSLDPYYSQKFIFNRYLFYLVIFFMGCSLAKNSRPLILLIGTIILSSLIIGAGCVWDKISLNEPRLFTSFHKNINITNYLVLYIPLLFSIAIFGKSKYLRFTLIIILISLLIPLIFVFSRATWFACALSLILVSCLKSRRSLIMMLIILLAAGFLMPAKVKNRATTFADESTSARVELWDRGIWMFKSSPITGVGVGMFEKSMYDQKYKISWDTPTTLAHAHNTYIEILAEMGLMGFFALIYIFFAFFNLFFKFLNRNFDNFKSAILSGLFGSIIASLALALSSTTFILGLQDAAMFWLLFGVSIGLIREKSKEIVKS